MKKGRISTIILILVFFVGLSLLLYPTVSDYWNSLHQSKAIANYADQVAELDDAVYEQLWADAKTYNQALLQKEDRYAMNDSEKVEYESQLNISDNGILGYIEIPSIQCSLPIYHGTDESVLQTAIGILREHRSLLAAKAPIVFCPVTGDCPVPDCLRIWIN